jgi:hypothetical protein
MDGAPNSFLADVLVLAGEDPEATARGRFAFVDREAIFRAQEATSA